MAKRAKPSFVGVLILERETTVPAVDEVQRWEAVTTIRGAVIPRSAAEARRQGTVRGIQSWTVYNWATSGSSDVGANTILAAR